MRKLKLWHWALIVLFGMAIINAISPPQPRQKKAPSPAPEQTFAAADPKFELIAGDAIFAMTFNPGADPRTLPDIAREKCAKRSFCKVLGWTDPKYAARGFPITGREVGAQVFDYSLNRQTGLDQALWSCRRWPRTPKKECLSAD